MPRAHVTLNSLRPDNWFEHSGVVLGDFQRLGRPLRTIVLATCVAQICGIGVISTNFGPRSADLDQSATPELTKLARSRRLSQPLRRLWARERPPRVLTQSSESAWGAADNTARDQQGMTDAMRTLMSPRSRRRGPTPRPASSIVRAADARPSSQARCRGVRREVSVAVRLAPARISTWRSRAAASMTRPTHRPQAADCLHTPPGALQKSMGERPGWAAYACTRGGPLRSPPRARSS